ncbi:hypothetical protein NMG60_11026669 [Bertholletia excelsa]
MKDRRRRGLPVSWNRFLRLTLTLVFFSGLAFSTLRLFFRETFLPRLGSSWRVQVMEAVSGEFQNIAVGETVIFPDEAMVFLNYPQSAPLFTRDKIDCVYLLRNSTEPHLKLSPASIDNGHHGYHIVRCPRPPRGSRIAVEVKANGHVLVGPMHRWDSLAYEAVIDRDNTTIVFVKGLNLRPGRVSSPSRLECVYGWDFTRPRLLLRSDVVSVAQEIVRCRTPLSVLTQVNNSMKVSVRVVGKRLMDSVARPDYMMGIDPPDSEPYEMCVCTMLRNQARFLREWVMYHARIGVQRWFVYDNNSDDDIDDLIGSLEEESFNITRHPWPWIKTQEAGFAHCALRARDICEWVGFIDVDEFLHLPSGLTLHEVLANQPSNVAELRLSCHNFGPSGHKRAPARGVTVGYTCRMVYPERHKSIIRPEALNYTLINSVHHFHLTSDFGYVNMDRNVMVINHYKYQVWEVFKEKFYRRVATYVSDWQRAENVGSKDRTPGLGTRAVEPEDWSTRFCEVVDTGLRDRVLYMFADPETRVLPWQGREDEEEGDIILVKPKGRRRRRTEGVAEKLL